MERPAEDSMQLNSALEAIEAGQIDEALSLLKAAAEAEPKNPETYYLAGLCLLRLRSFEAALDAFHRAIRIEGDWADPYLGGAQAQLGLGDPHASMQTLLHVLGFSPQHPDATLALLELLRRLTPDSHLPALEPALQQCLAHPDIDPAPLSRLCGQQLRLGIAEQWNPSDDVITNTTVAGLADSELWGLYLSRIINTDADLEKLFTHLRKHVCLNTGIEIDETTPVVLIAALARQCFLNEYVFSVSAEESTQCVVFDQILRDPHAGSDSIALAFSLSCMYRQPELNPTMRALAESLVTDYPWLDSLCRIAVFQPFEEAQIARTMPAVHPVHHDGSLQVQAQYEVNPYPRWHAPPAPPPSALLNEFRNRFSLRANVQAGTPNARVLVAGCGTGFEPIDIARRDSSIAVTAIDLSCSSLAYAKRRAKALGCSNIDFYQCDILDLPQTRWKFDLIVCTGVLHHMTDPLAGWRVLRETLVDNGMMRISLYSAHARRLIRIAHEQIKARGLHGQAEDIRAFRQWLLKDGRNEELGALLGSDDFYSMSGCRDLLFHVQEQQFTLPQIQAALDKLDLRFCGFDLGDAALLETFSDQYPAPDARRDLEKWDIFEQENPHIFAGMYQFWCEPT